MSLRFLTAGESHGPELTAILEGMPAGLTVLRDELDRMMFRRRQGFGRSGRMSIERDDVRVTAGVVNGVTTGGPIALRIVNLDRVNWVDRDVPPMTVPRPGHADLSATVKYGYGDLRHALERASARETTARVAVGALCAQLLRAFDITVGSYVTSIGRVCADVDAIESYAERFALADASDVRCPMPEAAARMRQAIAEASRAKDTLGGVFEVVALDVPPGLGSHVHWDRRLSGRLMGAVGSIQAIKGVSMGDGFGTSARSGTEVHDRFAPDGDRILRTSNRGGGVEGGISTGAPIVVRAAMKPISTTLTPLASVDLATGEASETVYERSDICAVPRAAVVGEAMVAFVLAAALLEKLGGDSIVEIRPRFERLRRARLGDLSMDGTPLRLEYLDEPADRHNETSVPADRPDETSESADRPDETGEPD